MPLQQLTELVVGWQCDIQFSEYIKSVNVSFPSLRMVLRLLFVHCSQRMLRESVHKSTSASKREPLRNAAFFCVYALPLVLSECALLCCVSRLLSVLWSRGETALHKAACQRHRAVCQLLVDAGASLRKTDSKVRQLHQPSPSPVC